MHPTLVRARRFQDLLALDAHDAPYVYQSIFSDDGWRARSLSKKKFALLHRIDDALRAMLQEDERVHFLTHGSSATFLESYFLGWVIQYVRRRAIVLTNQRILFLQIDGRRRPRELREQLTYPAIAEIDGTLLGNAKVRLRSGMTYVFNGMPRADRAYLRELVTQLTARTAPTTTAPEHIEHLCPHCYVVVEGFPLECPSCHGRFKSARAAGLLSLLFPGMGDLYMGHRAFGLMQVIVAGFLWLGWLLPNPDYPLSTGELMVGAVMLFAILHGLDALMTWYVARQGIYPAHHA